MYNISPVGGPEVVNTLVAFSYNVQASGPQTAGDT